MFCGAEGRSKRGSWSDCPTCKDLGTAMCPGLSVLKDCERGGLQGSSHMAGWLEGGGLWTDSC